MQINFPNVTKNQIKMAEGHGTDITEEDRSENIRTTSVCDVSKVDLSETYEVVGGKLSLHGVVYQRKLLMLFALRSVLKHKNFKLATEMKKADKVDDVILIYPKVNGVGNVFRFLQAKHRIGNRKYIRKISAIDLLKESKDDFSIPTYFQAYLNIVDNCEFLEVGDEILDLIICTNAGLWIGSSLEDLILTDDMFERIDEEDFIFGKTLRRFRNESLGRKKIVSLLMNCFSKFPQTFAKCISIGKTYEHPQRLNASKKELEFELLYDIVFLEEVVHLKTKTFREDFILGVNLSGIGEHFRRSLLSEWELLNDEGGFENWLKTKVVNVNGITEDHGLKVKSVAKKLSESVRKNLTKGLIKIYDKKSALYKNIDKLKLFNVLELTEGGLRFSNKFLHTNDLCETAKNVKKEFINNLAYFKIELIALEFIKFELKDLFQSKNLKIDEFCPEQHVKQFLSKLVFALDQPNEEELGITIKDELKSFLIGCSVDTAYSKFYTWIDEWLSSPKGKYLTEEDFKSFFNDLKEEVFFDLRDPVSNFTGRLKELNELHETLFQAESRAAIISQTASISGLGGIGKSELARRFAKKHKKEFNSIIWIDSESQETTEFSFRRLAYDRLNINRKNSNGDDKRIESIVEEVYQRLEGKRNLFVFDNAEQLRSVGEGSNGIQKYISPSSEGNWNYYIITSRNRKWGAMRVVDIDKFTDDEAMEFFRISFGDLYEFDSEELMKLTDALGNFPLAMQQAVAYIKETSDQLRIFNKRFTVSDYLVLFHEKSKELLQHELPNDCNDHYTRTTYTTMKISIESISSKENGSLSVKILNVMSYICPEKIESSLLSTIFKDENELGLSKALLLLHQYSMISLDDSTASIHRLLQLVIRLSLKEGELENDVLKSIVESMDPSQLEHSMSVCKYVCKYEELVKEYVAFPVHIIHELIIKIKIRTLVSFATDLESILRRVFGYYHRQTTYLRSIVGLALAMNDRWQEGVKLIQSTYEEQREISGESNPVTLHSQQLLVEICRGSFKTFDSGTISEDVFEKSKAAFGENSDLTVLSKSHLAYSLYQALNYQEALKFFEEIKDLQIRSASPKFQSIIHNAELMVPIIRIELNEDYSSNCEIFARKIDEMFSKTEIYVLGHCLSILDLFVCSLFGEVIVKTFNLYYKNFVERYGCDNVHLIEWRVRYGIALSFLGFFDDALKEFLEAYDVQKKILDEKHRKVLQTKFWIASCHCFKGNHREALRLHQEVLAVTEGIGDDSEMCYSDSKSAIGIEYSHLGEYDTAIKILERVIETEKSNHMVRRKYFLKVQLEYAGILQAAGFYEKSAMKYSEIQKLQVDCLGERNVTTLDVSLKYSQALYDCGNRKGSLQVLNRVRCLLNEMDVKEDTLLSLNLNASIALVMRRFGMNLEEKNHILKALKAAEKLFGRNRPRTFYLMCKLALVETKLGNCQNAGDLLRDVENNLSGDENVDAGLKLCIAEVYMELKDFQKSLEIIKQVQKFNNENGNLNQKEISHLFLAIALAMGKNGDLDGSLKILRELSSQQSSADRSEILTALKSLVFVYRLKGDIDGAIKTCEEVLRQESETLAKDDLDLISTKIFFSDLVLSKGRNAEFIEMLKRCHKTVCDKLFNDNSELLILLKVRFCIGRILCNAGELEDGKKYLFEVYEKQKNLLGEDDRETAATKKFLTDVIRR